MTNTVAYLTKDPSAVGADIRGQSACAFPDSLTVLNVGRNRWSSSKSTGNLEHGSLDENRNGVEVSREGRQPKSHRLEGYGSSSAERVEHLRKITFTRTHDLGSSFSDDPRIVRRFPRHKALQDVEETPALLELSSFGGERLWMR
jgi:hypothetical protein